MEFANINIALVELLAKIESSGRHVTVRSSSTREIGPIQFTLRNPRQRCLVIRHRNNNIFASIAETMWVLAGRNDIAFLSNYLPRAADFSDDGITWRGGYGPRLRDWRGTDQVDEVRKILLDGRSSRRAVAVIFDPAQDYVDSKDIPCNNWLNFTIREDALHCHIAVRSNDVVWGFSGINAFEWSVLLEMMAFWVSARVGHLTFSVTSAHIYDRHFERAGAIVAARPRDVYSDRALSTYAFNTPWPEFGRVVHEWFLQEEQIRLGSSLPQGTVDFPDPLLGAFLQMMRIYWAVKSGSPASTVLHLIEPLEGSDLAEAALEYASRTVDGFPDYHHPGEAQLQASPALPKAGGDAFAESAEGRGSGRLPDLWSAISTLHASKSLAYGDSWKRRGELIGIMANIARKVDRVQLVDAFIDDIDETALDTGVDLLVYCLKYATYLMDTGEMERPASLREVTAPLSDGRDGFDALLAEVSRQLSDAQDFIGSDRAATDVRDDYDNLERVVEGKTSGTATKADALNVLISSATRLVFALVQASPASYQRFLRPVSGAQLEGNDHAKAAAESRARAQFFAEHNATRRFSYE